MTNPRSSLGSTQNINEFYSAVKRKFSWRHRLKKQKQDVFIQPLHYVKVLKPVLSQDKLQPLTVKFETDYRGSR